MSNKIKPNYLQSSLLYLDLDSNKREVIQLKHEMEKAKQTYDDELKTFSSLLKSNGITIGSNIPDNKERCDILNGISNEMKEIEADLIAFDQKVKEFTNNSCEEKMLEYKNMKTKLGAFLEISEIYCSLKKYHNDFNLICNIHDYSTKLARMKHLVEMFNSRNEGTLGREFERQFIDKLEKEIFERENSFLMYLKKYFRDFVTYSKFSENSTTTFEFYIKKERKQFEDILSSMYILDNLDIQLRDFVKFLKELLEMSSKYKICLNEKCVQENDDEYIMKFDFKTSSKDEQANPNNIYSFLNLFFTNIDKIFQNIIIDSSKTLKLTFLGFLGSKIEENVIQIIKEEYLMPLLPLEDEGIDNYKNILMNGKKIISLLKKENFFQNNVDYLEEFETNLDKICTQRRCMRTALISREYLLNNMDKKVLIKTRMIEVTNVDIYLSSYSISCLKFDILPQLVLSYEREEKYFVSDGIYQIINEVGALYDSIDKVQQIQKEIILLNIKNIFKMVISLVPRIHSKLVQSNLDMGALFYNNYFYLLYCLYKYSLIDDSEEMINIVTKLRILASDSIEDHFNKLIYQIMKELKDGLLIIEVHKSLDSFELFKEMANFGLFFQNKVTELNELFPLIMYQDILTNIVKRCLINITNVIMNISDFRSDQCELITHRVNDLFDIFNKPFKKISGDESIKNRCPKEYYRLFEVIFCLNHSLDDIEDRYCDEDCPSEFLEKHELKSLIRAIFQNTDKRAKILKKIN
uniref:Exocyst complex component Sec10 n=1 Tax=Parastrongyloides trichosuri TaxID=131310 RepID=A0A0N5A608_PARTI